MYPICKAISTHQYKQHQPKATRINETTPVTVLTGLLGSKAWPSRMLLGGSLKTSARVRQKLEAHQSYINYINMITVMMI